MATAGAGTVRTGASAALATGSSMAGASRIGSSTTGTSMTGSSAFTVENSSVKYPRMGESFIDETASVKGSTTRAGTIDWAATNLTASRARRWEIAASKPQPGASTIVIGRVDLDHDASGRFGPSRVSEATRPVPDGREATSETIAGSSSTSVQMTG